MKTTIIAKQDFVLKQSSAQVRILKGDSYEVYGNVFAVGNVLVDLTHYYAMFDAVTSSETAQPLYLKAIHDLRIKSKVTGKEVTIVAGQILKLWSNVISIEGVTFDICDYCYNFERYYRVTPPAVTDLAFDAELKALSWTGTTGSYRITTTVDEGEPEVTDQAEATVDFSEAEAGAYTVSVVQLNELGDASPAAELEFEIATAVVDAGDGDGNGAKGDANNAPVVDPVPETQEPAQVEQPAETQEPAAPETQEPGEGDPNEVQIPEL